LEVGGNLIVGGDSLCCDSLERGESSFIGSGVVEQAGWGVETKSRELKSKLNRLRIQWSTEKMLLKRVVVPHRIFAFWPHWHTMRGVTYYPPKVTA
jgi:hypothetical protein